MTKLIRLSILIGGALLIAVAVWYFWPEGKKPLPPPPPNQTPVAVDKPHIRQEETVAGRQPDKKTRGRITLEFPADSTQPEKPRVRIEVEIPRNEEDPPIVHGSIPGIQATYQDFRDPFFTLRVRPMTGASVDFKIGPSPFGALSILTIAETFNAGVGVDKFGLGPFVSWEFLREFNLGAKHNTLRFEGDSPVMAFIAYRF